MVAIPMRDDGGRAFRIVFLSFFLSFNFFFALNSSSVIHLYIILNDFFCDVPSPCLFFSSGARSLDALGSRRKEVKGKRKEKKRKGEKKEKQNSQFIV